MSDEATFTELKAADPREGRWTQASRKSNCFKCWEASWTYLLDYVYIAHTLSQEKLVIFRWSI